MQSVKTFDLPEYHVSLMSLIRIISFKVVTSAASWAAYRPLRFYCGMTVLHIVIIQNHFWGFNAYTKAWLRGSVSTDDQVSSSKQWFQKI